MNTRAVRKFSEAHGISLYRVERFANFDFVTERGEKVALSSNAWTWRVIDTFDNVEDARIFARMLSRSEREEALVHGIVATFKNGMQE